MKSTTVFALVASLMPVAMAAPYNLVERDAEADVKYEIDYVTDVEVATVYTQVTQYWTGEPAAETPSPATTSSTSAVQTSVPAHNRHHDHNGDGRGRKTTVQYTVQETSTPEPAPTTTSTVVATPPPPSPPSPTPTPTTFSTMVAPASTYVEETSTSTTPAAATWEVPSITMPASGQYKPAVYPDSTIVPSFVNSQWLPYAPIPTNLAKGPADYFGLPNDAMQGIRKGPESYQGDNWKNAVLARHNAWREKWGVGPLVWNSTEADGAQNLANKANAQNCFPGHDRNTAQNLAMTMSSTDAPGPDDSPNGLVDQWGSESKFWQISHRDGSEPQVMGKANNGDWEQQTGELLHFTAMMWRDTTSVGCGLQQCAGNTWYLACNYYPWSNMGDGSTANYVDAEGRKGTYAYQVPSVPQY